MTIEMPIRDLLPPDAQALDLHPAFWEVALGTVRVITAIQTKYREAGEREAVLTTSILRSLATCLATYAVRPEGTADVDRKGRCLVDHIADGLLAVLGSGPHASAAAPANPHPA